MTQHYNLSHAATVVKRGGVIAYPTEAVFGLGCDPLNETAIQHILNIKQRPPEKGLILIASDWHQLQPYVAPLNESQLTTLFATWPGPITWLVPAAADVSPLLRGTHTSIAVRITAHPIASALCQTLQHPLVSTSANVSNNPPLKTYDEVAQQFGDKIDYIVPGEVGNLSQPTEIRDLSTLAVIRNNS